MVHAAPNSNTAEEIKYAYWVPECVSYFQTLFYECTQQPHLKIRKNEHFSVTSIHPRINQRFVRFFFSFLQPGFLRKWSDGYLNNVFLLGWKMLLYHELKMEKGMTNPIQREHRSLPELIFFLDAHLWSAQAAEIDCPASTIGATVIFGFSLQWGTSSRSCLAFKLIIKLDSADANTFVHVCVCVSVCTCCISTSIMFPYLPSFSQYCISTVLSLQVPHSSIC